jgi:hypothetical protein
MKATKILKVTAYAELGIGIITAIFTLVENSHVSQYQLDRGEDIPFSAFAMPMGIVFATLIVFASIMVVVQSADNIEKTQKDVEQIANKQENR